MFLAVSREPWSGETQTWGSWVKRARCYVCHPLCSTKLIFPLREKGDLYCLSTGALTVTGTGLGLGSFYCYPVLKLLLVLVAFL